MSTPPINPFDNTLQAAGAGTGTSMERTEKISKMIIDKWKETSAAEKLDSLRNFSGLLECMGEKEVNPGKMPKTATEQQRQAALPGMHLYVMNKAVQRMFDQVQSEGKKEQE